VSTTASRPRPRRRRRSRRGPLLRLLLGLAVALALFGLGVALGEALNDNPQPGGTQTLVRTLRPGAVPAETVTVTVGTS
jgi:hypothetical protein